MKTLCTNQKLCKKLHQNGLGLTCLCRAQYIRCCVLSLIPDSMNEINFDSMHVTTLSIMQHSKFPLMGKIPFISPSMEQY